MGCDSHETILFENADWRLSPSGLEHKANGYFIAADEVADRRSDGGWSWPAHLAEKLWYRRELFEPAFAQALAVCGHRAESRGTKEFVVASGAGHANLEETPRRLGAAVVAQLASLGEQLGDALETARRGRTAPERRAIESDPATERPWRRAA